jgi:hypothetical protein
LELGLPILSVGVQIFGNQGSGEFFINQLKTVYFLIGYRWNPGWMGSEPGILVWMIQKDRGKSLLSIGLSTAPNRNCRFLSRRWYLFNLFNFRMLRSWHVNCFAVRSTNSKSMKISGNNVSTIYIEEQARH